MMGHPSFNTGSALATGHQKIDSGKLAADASRSAQYVEDKYLEDKYLEDKNHDDQDIYGGGAILSQASLLRRAFSVHSANSGSLRGINNNADDEHLEAEKRDRAFIRMVLSLDDFAAFDEVNFHEQLDQDDADDRAREKIFMETLFHHQADSDNAQEQLASAMDSRSDLQRQRDGIAEDANRLGKNIELLQRQMEQQEARESEAAGRYEEALEQRAAAGRGLESFDKDLRERFGIDHRDLQQDENGQRHFTDRDGNRIAIDEATNDRLNLSLSSRQQADEAIQRASRERHAERELSAGYREGMNGFSATARELEERTRRLDSRLAEQDNVINQTQGRLFSSRDSIHQSRDQLQQVAAKFRERDMVRDYFSTEQGRAQLHALQLGDQGNPNDPYSTRFKQGIIDQMPAEVADYMIRKYPENMEGVRAPSARSSGPMASAPSQPAAPAAQAMSLNAAFSTASTVAAARTENASAETAPANAERPQVRKPAASSDMIAI